MSPSSRSRLRRSVLETCPQCLPERRAWRVGRSIDSPARCKEQRCADPVGSVDATLRSGRTTGRRGAARRSAQSFPLPRQKRYGSPRAPRAPTIAPRHQSAHYPQAADWLEPAHRWRQSPGFRHEDSQPGRHRLAPCENVSECRHIDAVRVAARVAATAARPARCSGTAHPDRLSTRCGARGASPWRQGTHAAVPGRASTADQSPSPRRY